MAKSMEEYAANFEKDPVGTGKSLIWKGAFFLLALSVTFSIIGSALGWFGEAAKVAREEFGPREMLRKYEWFKDAAAQLDKKKADIQVYESRVKSLNESYRGVARQKWARDDREQSGVWQSEVAGVKASFNSLAADYNSQMAKFNWRFANKGMLPQGASEPLPREYKTYVTE